MIKNISSDYILININVFLSESKKLLQDFNNLKNIL